MTWIFGYGSLMWHPGFAYAERRAAVLNGYHRDYMSVSTRNRGTPDCPGMMLSLVPGGRCVGVAARIRPGCEAEVLAYLDKREGEGRSNRRIRAPLRVYEGPDAPPERAAVLHAHAFVPVITACNYVWGLPAQRKAELIAQAAGRTGSAYNYLHLLMEELARIGAREPALEALYEAAGACRRANAASIPARTLAAVELGAPVASGRAAPGPPGSELPGAALGTTPGASAAD